MTPINRPLPLWFRLVNRLPRGRFRIRGWLKNAGLLERNVNVPFYDRHITLPLSMVSGDDLQKYQLERISRFASICDAHLGRFDLIDCGAHVGLFSSQFCMLSKRVRKLTAIEPNPQLFALLTKNLEDVDATSLECVNAALSDFEGRGRLVASEDDPDSLDAMYLLIDPDGDLDVTTLSGLLRRRTEHQVALKVDVEGQEVQVLSGAADEIRSLAGVVVFIEIHAAILKRIGLSDTEMLARLEKIRRFRWFNADDGRAINSALPILPQVRQDRQCDLIGVA